MRIHRMTATFGKLQGRTLELRDGLNILQAPNETGKSTWCAFLLSILYGINSRERDRTGFIADKNRYAPWSGAAMSGRMDCSTDLGELTLTRSTRRQASPMGEFSAVYAGTNEPVPGLTGTACGETLLGISREVFERSAFIRQNNLSISQNADLERRIAALISSGQEDTSYTEAAEALKKQLNRRRHNKTGQLPALEAELAELDRQLAESDSLARQLTEARAEVSSLSARAQALQGELDQWDRWEAARQRRVLSDAAAAAEAAEAKAAQVREQLQKDQIPENETIARLRGAIVNLETTRKAVDKARAERDEAMKALLRAEAAVNESPFAGQTAEEARKSAASVPDSAPWPLSELLPSIFLGALALILSIISILGINDAFANAIFFGIPCAISALVIPIYKNHKWQKETSAFLKKHGVSSAAELRMQAAAYAKLCEARDTAQANANAKSAAADTLYNTLTSNEQGILLEVRRFAPGAFDIPTADRLLRACAVRRKELAEAESAAREARLRCDLQAQQLPEADVPAEELPVPPRSREAVTADLEAVRAALAQARSGADRLTGQLHGLTPPDQLRARQAELEDQRAGLEAEYSAIRLAMETLDQANTTLQNRFSPELGRRAAEIFAQLTGSRYSGVVLDRSFRLSAEPAGDPVFRDAALLSAGTLDQLYLAVRLAICDLVLPPEKEVPIVLDDALANFDDDRCAAALEFLKAAAGNRQILLFTCHSREAEFFAGDGEVPIQRLTDAGEEV
ncbi:MAG TPA: AAA family ATPase [Candidatus Oscillibacter excrementavium]|nr:AAA family ATPase [Candidatus Oscillibacter excrementavium]